jgi:recombination protein RecT
MAEKKNEAQQQDAFADGAQQPAGEAAGTTVQPQPQVQNAQEPQPPQPPQEEGLVKISQGLPPQLKPLQNCFTAPYKTFLQNGKNIRDLQRECNFAAQAMLNNPYLITCAQKYPDHFVNALKNVVLTGMTLNPTLKLAYLVPYKGKVELQASYMGKKSFAVNTGLVLDIEAYLVYKGELFEIEQGSNAHITHKPNPWGAKKKEDILGGYYLIKYPNGTQQFDTMSFDEIDGIRKRSPSVGKGKQSPWDTDFTEMCKKTLINRAYKQIPKQGMTAKAAKALEILNRVDDMAAKDINYGQKSKFDDFEEPEEEV